MLAHTDRAFDAHGEGAKERPSGPRATSEDRAEGDRRARRIEHLLTVVRDIRGWTKAQLAEALGRHPANLVPPGGNAKLDYLIILADILEWDVGRVSRWIWEGPPPVIHAAHPTAENTPSIRETVVLAFRRLADRKYHDARTLAGEVGRRAESPWDLHWHHILEASIRGEQGLYEQADSHLLQALDLVMDRRQYRRQVESSLAQNCEYLGNISMAVALTTSVIEDFRDDADPEVRTPYPYACLTRARARNKLARRYPRHEEEFSLLAMEDAELAMQLCRDYERTPAAPGFTEFADFPSVALMAELVALECRCRLRTVDAAREVDALIERLDPITDLASTTVTTTMLEAFGWLCVHALHIARRDLRGAELERAMAVLTNKGLDIADHVPNWSMRVEVLCAQYGLMMTPRQTVVFGNGIAHLNTDAEDERQIEWTMARVPSFFHIGRLLLDTLHRATPRGSGGGGGGIECPGPLLRSDLV